MNLERPVRTGTQGVVSLAFVEFIDAFFFNFDDRQYGALVVFLTIVLGWLQVAIENKTGKTFLRTANE